jgi:two-component system, NarL family, nitrate/nitrite response regulator NarL
MYEVELQLLIIAEDPLARTGLAALLADQPRYAVAGQVPADTDLAAALEVYQPDVLLWDLGWQPATALEQVADLRALSPPVVALLPDESMATQAWAAGVRGLLLRDAGAERIVAALTAASQGLTVLDPGLVETLQPSEALPSAALAEELTPREQEVLQLLAEGLSNKAIGFRLDISEHTVKFHVNAIMTKLGAQSRTEAVVRATRLGLLVL